MIKVLLEDKYFTGSYAKVGGLVAGDNQEVVEVEELPKEEERLKLLAYKLVKNKWTFDEAKYEELVAKQEAEEQAQKEAEKQIKSNEQLTADVNYMAMMMEVDLDEQ